MYNFSTRGPRWEFRRFQTFLILVPQFEHVTPRGRNPLHMRILWEIFSKKDIPPRPQLHAYDPRGKTRIHQKLTEQCSPSWKNVSLLQTSVCLPFENDGPLSYGTWKNSTTLLRHLWERVCSKGFLCGPLNYTFRWGTEVEMGARSVLSQWFVNFCGFIKLRNFRWNNYTSRRETRGHYSA